VKFFTDMNELESLSNSLETTLKDSDLQNITADLAETFTDELLSDGLLKDIPIIGTIVGLAKASLNLKDRLFVKKLISFMAGINKINPEKRLELISKIDNSEKFKVKVGEKLLYILDKCDDHISAKYVAVLFASFLNKEISYEEYLRGAGIIQNIFIIDLEKFIETDTGKLEITITSSDPGINDFQNTLITSGICTTTIEPVSVRDQDDHKRSEKYSVSGGEMIIYLTDIGQKLKQVLKEKQ
jgi:hypothetical protein